MSKVLLALGLVIFGALTAWGIGVTYHTPSASNIIVTFIFAIIEVVIFMFFIKGDARREV